MDRREHILERLVAIAGALPGVNTAVRNQDEISERKRPAVAIFDADEAADGVDECWCSATMSAITRSAATVTGTSQRGRRPRLPVSSNSSPESPPGCEGTKSMPSSGTRGSPCRRYKIGSGRYSAADGSARSTSSTCATMLATCARPRA